MQDIQYGKKNRERIITVQNLNWLMIKYMVKKIMAYN
jgi:hypothetical protein